MRILHVIRSVDLRSGGTIECIRQLNPAFAKLGVEAEVMSLDAPGDPGTTDFPVPLHLMGPTRSRYGYSPRAVPWLAKHHANYDAVLVNGLWQYSGFAAWRALHATSTPYYVYPQGMLDPWFKRHYPLKHLKKWLYWPWAEYRVLRDAKAVLFTSEEERIEARKSFWLYQCREQVTGFGIALPPGDPATQRALFLERHPELKDKRLILFLGRIHEKKGCDLLLRAWKEILESSAGNAQDGHLVMAGPANHDYGAAMKKLTQDLGLEQRVSWVGMLTDDFKWGSLHASEAFVLPSHQENFGVAVVEALACGVPVLISNKINIWREILEDNAGLIENDDLAGTIQLLKRWLALGPARKEEMQARARDCFAARFHIDRTVELLMTLFKT